MPFTSGAAHNCSQVIKSMISGQRTQCDSASRRTRCLRRKNGKRAPFLP